MTARATVPSWKKLFPTVVVEHAVFVGFGTLSVGRGKLGASTIARDLERLPALGEQRIAPASTFPTAFAGGQALWEMSKWERGAFSPRLSTWIRTSMFSGGGLLLVADAISGGGERRRPAAAASGSTKSSLVK
jgi:hypothetical protein